LRIEFGGDIIAFRLILGFATTAVSIHLLPRLSNSGSRQEHGVNPLYLILASAGHQNLPEMELADPIAGGPSPSVMFADALLCSIKSHWSMPATDHELGTL
jgi:hypothetical protein